MLFGVVVCSPVRGAPAHRGSLSRVAGRSGAGAVQEATAACCDHLHNSRHTTGTLPMCRKCGLLQQPLKGVLDFVFYSPFICN